MNSPVNTTDVEFQGQHRISQIYLKQFGFKRDGKWYISVWRKFLSHTSATVGVRKPFARQLSPAGAADFYDKNKIILS